jgi:hypothetical protein
MSGKSKPTLSSACGDLGKAIAALVDTAGGLDVFAARVKFGRESIRKWITGHTVPSQEAALALIGQCAELRPLLEARGALRDWCQRGPSPLSLRARTSTRFAADYGAGKVAAKRRRKALDRDERLEKIRRVHERMLDGRRSGAVKVARRIPATRDGDFTERMADIGIAACDVRTRTEA